MENNNQAFYASSIAGHEWVYNLNLSARSRNAIINNHIASLRQLRAMSFLELMSLKGLGETGANEIIERMQQLPLDEGEYSDDSESAQYDTSPAYRKIINESEAAGSISIYALPLSARTANALFNNGIRMVSDLAQYLLSDLMTLQGFGLTAYNEVVRLLERPDFKDILQLKERTKLTLDEYLTTRINKGHLAIFDSYYGLNASRGSVTLQSVSEEYGVTRERIRQLVKKVSEKVTNAVNNGTVDDAVYRLLLAHVGEPVFSLPELSDIYRKEAIVRLFTHNKECPLDIYKNPALRSEWIIRRDDSSIDSQVIIALEALRVQVSPVRISELADTIGVDEAILYDLSQVTISSSGDIALNTNKVALGIDIRQKILDFMDHTVSPVTIEEICQQLDLKENQVRGRLYNMSEVVNVGKSTYGLAKYGYTGESIAQIAERLLREDGQPIHIDKITSFVTKYKSIADSSVAAMLSFYPDTFANLGSGYYALTEWGYISTNYRMQYEVSAVDAVLSIFKETDRPLSTRDVLALVQEKYGDRTTSKSVTVSSACVKLYERGVLSKLGTDRSPFYRLKQISENQ